MTSHVPKAMGSPIPALTVWLRDPQAQKNSDGEDLSVCFTTVDTGSSHEGKSTSLQLGWDQTRNIVQ